MASSSKIRPRGIDIARGRRQFGTRQVAEVIIARVCAIEPVLIPLLVAIFLTCIYQVNLFKSSILTNFSQVNYSEFKVGKVGKVGEITSYDLQLRICY
jgi:hypothetical protein